MDDLPPAKVVVPTNVTEKVTHRTQLEFRYEWKVNSVSLNDFDATTCITSPQFSTHSDDVWCLNLRFGDHDFYLQLRLVSSKKSQVKAKYRYTVNGDKITKDFIYSTFVPGLYDNGAMGLFCSKQMEDILTEDSISCNLTVEILCEVVSETTTFDILNRGNGVPFNLPKCQIVEDVKGLFGTELFTDVTIKICDRQVRAHKTILAMRSPVFWAMFEHEMAEKMESEVNIIDVDNEVFGEVLRFIYTDEVENIEKMADKLLFAANKYQLDRLKAMCEEVLRLNLTVENAAEMLILADVYDAQQLKTRVAQYIIGNLSRVLETESFQSMTQSHPILMRELLHASVLNQNLKLEELL